jgi:L-lactate dehydrogenase
MGRVGTAIVYEIAQKDLVSEIILINRNQKKALAEALDISHSLSQKDITIKAGDYKDISDSYITIITAGVGRLPNESRDDLLFKNASVLKEVVSNIIPYYRNSIVIVVSNPVDLMAHLVSELLKAEYGKVVGTGTLLDTARLRYEISNKLSLPQNQIECLVIGEHGANCIPLWNSIKIIGDNEKKHSENKKMDHKNILENVHKAGDTIIEGKGFTSCGIAFETGNLVKNLVDNSNKILPVSISLKGEYDTNANVFLSLPCIITEQGVKETLVPEISDKEISLFKKSTIKLQNHINQIF